MDDVLSIAVSNAVAATLLALVALAVGAVYRRPALVHGMWLLVLLKLVTPPLVFLPVAWLTVAESPPEVASAREEPPIASLPAAEDQMAPVIDSPNAERGRVSAPRESAAFDIEDPPSVDTLGALTRPRSPEPSLWPQMLRILWGVGALLWFLLALERLHHFRRLLRFAKPAPAALQERARRLADALGLTRCPRVRLMPGRVAPMLWAIGGPPRLLVPANLLDVLSDEQLDTLLLHELAHLRRRDHWVRVLEFVVMGLYWWHPVVWYARRELREAEEQCCDAWVVSTLPGAGRTYASALLDTLDFLSTAQAALPPLASGLGQIADLKRRLTMIMQGNTPRSLTWPGCLAVIALGLMLLPMMPSLHGQAPGREDALKPVEKAARDLERAKAELEKAKAVLEAEMARLEKQKADVAQAEAQLKKATAQRIYQQTIRTAKLREDGAIVELRKGKAEGEKKATYHIEITFTPEGSVNTKEIVEKIKKALPENLRGSVAVHVGIAVEKTSDATAIRLTPPGSGVRVLVPQPPPPPRSKSSDKRINELEKKLEKVIHELHELRKEMNRPQPQSLLPTLPPRTTAPVRLPIDPTAPTPLNVVPSTRSSAPNKP